MIAIKIAIADDHQLFREGLGFILGQQPDFNLLFDVEDGELLIQKLKIQTPDVILLDLKMPRLDGMECIRYVKTNYPSLKVIVLSMHSQEDFILHCFELGANGYLLKNYSSEDMIKAIRTVFEKGFYFDDFVSQIMLKGLKKKKVIKPGNLDFNIQITNRENEILDLIFKEMTTQQIADKLFLSYRTIETHRKNLLEKFGTNNTTGLILKAIKYGFKTVE